MNESILPEKTIRREKMASYGRKTELGVMIIESAS
jgi:hypothetical protein